MPTLENKLSKMNIKYWRFFEQSTIFDLEPYIEEIKTNPQFAYLYANFVIKKTLAWSRRYH